MKKIKTSIASIALAVVVTMTSVSAGSTFNTIDTQAKTRQQYVYIAASGRGECYHLSKNCSRMRGRVVKLTIKKAKSQGYRPCKKCYR